MKTRVINTSGATRHFGFLPPHGVSLDSDVEREFDGDLRSTLGGGRGRHSRSREIAALDVACDAGDLCLVELVEECCSSSSA